MNRSCSFSICLHFATVCLFYENFCVEKNFSDIIQIFQWDQFEKTLSWIGFKSYVYQHEIFGWCQTHSIFLICFLLLFIVMAPKINCPWKILKMKRLEIEIFKNLYLNVFLTNPLMEFLQFMIVRRISSIQALKIVDFITFHKRFHF